jgi:hypothetical protein
LLKVLAFIGSCIVILTQRATIPLAKSGSDCLKIKGINLGET